MMKISIKDEFNTRVLIAKYYYSLRKFANDISISHGYLSQILSCKCNPSPFIAFKIASALNKRTEDIFLIQTVDESTNEVS